MQVIGAGLGGTGTLQAKAALERLSFGPCYHIKEIQQHPEQTAFWQAVANGGPDDWDALFSAYESSVDFPACVVYAELMEAYPDAKVLLTVRDPGTGVPACAGDDLHAVDGPGVVAAGG